MTSGLATPPGRVPGLGNIGAALLCHQLKATTRIALPCHTALCAVRGAWAAGAADPGAEIMRSGADAAGRLFEAYARQLWAECDDRLLSEFGLAGYSGFSSWVSYQIRCLRIAELLSLLALRVRDEAPELAAEIAEWLVEVARAPPGRPPP